MAFGKAKKVTTFDPRNAYQLATKALREQRTNMARLAICITLDDTLMNQFSNKALLEMLGKMVGLDHVKGKKDLTKSFEDSVYRNLEDQIVIPARIIKAAIVNGAIGTGGVVSKAELKRDLRVVGHTCPVIFQKSKGPTKHVESCTMDIKLVRNSSGVPDVRSRALIPGGSKVECVLQFPTTLSPDKVTAAFEAAGASIGVCDYRPENGGLYGTFTIEILPESEVDRIVKACSSPEKPYTIPPEYLRAFDSLRDSGSDSAKKAVAVVDHVNGQTNGKRGRVPMKRAEA